jgi:hypothetical protein
MALPAAQTFRVHLARSREDVGRCAFGLPPLPFLVRTIFVQPTPGDAWLQLAKVAEFLHTKYSEAAQILTEAQEDILAYLTLNPRPSTAAGRSIWS